MASSERFGYEWNRYSDMTGDYELMFRNWVAPLDENYFRGKTILDAGSGMGRNSYWPLRWGAAKLTAFDLDSRSVESTRRTLAQFPQAMVMQKSIYDIDWKNQFDFVMSIGVVHHLERPREAIAKLIQAAKPGGTILVWLYSYEGNEWIVRFVDPVRKHITSKLPVSLVHALCYVCSVPLWGFIKIFRGPTLYLRQLSKFSFWHIHSIAFDQLIPKVANYWTDTEIRALCAGLPVRTIDVKMPPNKMGWTLTMTK